LKTCELEQEAMNFNVMRQISKQSSGNDRGLHVQITKKLEELNLKSPKAAKNMNWMGLVEHALGIDDLDEEDDEPYTPGMKTSGDVVKKMDFLKMDDQK
jgi:hypothetical protein